MERVVRPLKRHVNIRVDRLPARAPQPSQQLKERVRLLWRHKVVTGA